MSAETVKDIVIFDLDGTLSNPENRTHFLLGAKKDWRAFYKACGGDAPISNTVAIFKALKISKLCWVVTGREDTVKPETLQWFAEHGIEPDNMLMRPEGDYRTDTVLKKELVTSGQIPFDRILCVFEDRNSVVDMWREMGITCYHVAPGDF
jgi:phosphoglycolate phosphatase-like HAD superfamily hydrolase